MLDFQHTENVVVELQRDHKLNLQDWSYCRQQHIHLMFQHTSKPFSVNV